MRGAKSIGFGAAMLTTAILAVAGARRPVPRFATGAGALLLMATVMPVAPALSTASAAALAGADGRRPVRRQDPSNALVDWRPGAGGQGPDARGQACARLRIGDAGPRLRRVQRHEVQPVPGELPRGPAQVLVFRLRRLHRVHARTGRSPSLAVRRVVEFQAGQATATPLEFVDFFRGLGVRPQAGWRADPTAASIQPGDILAWQPEAPGAGHSVIPLVAPEPIAGSGRLRWEVVVEDSTQDPHGPFDTRSRRDRSASATPWRRPAEGQLRYLPGWASAPWC